MSIYDRLEQDVRQALLRPPSEKARLGMFVGGEFRIIAADPAFFYIRYPDNSFRKVLHKGRIGVPADLNTVEAQSKIVNVGLDIEGDYSILSYDKSQQGAYQQQDGGGILLPAHTHDDRYYTQSEVDALLGSSGGNLVTVGNYADSRPAAPHNGDTFVVADGYWKELYYGGAWHPWRTDSPLVAPPTTGWSWVNQGTASVDETKGALYLEIPMSTGVNIRARVRSQPSAPYTVTALVKAGLTGSSLASGLCWYDGTKIIELALGAATLNVVKYTNVTTASASYLAISATALLWNDNLVWLRIADDGANRICSVSVDGKHWILIHSIGNTDFLTATHVGYFADAIHATQTQNSGLLLVSWEEA